MADFPQEHIGKSQKTVSYHWHPLLFPTGTGCYVGSRLGCHSAPCPCNRTFLFHLQRSEAVCFWTCSSSVVQNSVFTKSPSVFLLYSQQDCLNIVTYLKLLCSNFINRSLNLVLYKLNSYCWKVNRKVKSRGNWSSSFTVWRFSVSLENKTKQDKKYNLLNSASDPPSGEFLGMLLRDIHSKGPYINWDLISWKSPLFLVITGCHVHIHCVTEGVKKTSKVRDGR